MSGSILSGVNFSLKILQVSYQLKAVGEQTTDLLRTTEHVCRNLNEARRLRHLKTSLIGADDGAWMDNQIKDCEQALQEVQQLIEPARVANATTESINAKIRVLWVLRDCPKVANKHDRLNTCHQTLNNIILILQTRHFAVTALPPTGSDLEEPPPYTKDMEMVFNWRSQMRSKKKIATLENNDVFTSVTDSMSDSTPVPPCPDATLSFSTENGQRPPLVSFLSEPSVKAAPPPVYPCYNGHDRHPVFDFERDMRLAKDIWSPVHLPQSMNDFVNNINSSHTSGPCVPPKILEDYRQMHDQGFLTINSSSTSGPCVSPKILRDSRQMPDQRFSTTVGLTRTAEEPAKATQSFPKIRGREWLASYAATNNVRHSYGGSRSSG